MHLTRKVVIGKESKTQFPITRASLMAVAVISGAGVFAFPLSAQSASSQKSSDSVASRDASVGPRNIFRDLYITGSIEIGRALSSTTNDTTGVVLAAGRKPATTLSGSLALDFGKFRFFGTGGASLSQSNEGGFGRVASVVDIITSASGNPLLQLSGDLTSVYSPLLPSLKAAGVTLSAGDPSVISGSLRTGGRWRAGVFTPATSVEVGKLMTRSIGSAGTEVSGRLSGGASPSLLSAYIYSSVVMTRAPQSRNFVVIGENKNVIDGSLVDPAMPLIPYSEQSSFTSRRQVTVGDVGANVQFAHGNWIVGVRGMSRLGSPVSLWDDPVPNKGFLRQDRDGKLGMVARGMWFALPNLAITAEAGRQLSDPIMGFSGLKYASISAKMSFESGKNRQGWLRKKQFQEAAAILRDVSVKAQLVSRKLDRSVNYTGDSDHANDPKSAADKSNSWYEFLIEVPTGDTVEIAGDFSGWEPQKLSVCDVIPKGVKVWCGKFKLAPGVYKIVYRVNGGEWEVPEGLSRIADGFDGEVGLLIVK